MKKFAIFALLVIFVLSLAACGRRKDNMVEDPTTMPTTVIPTETMPTTGNNIPDPTVNDNSTENKDGMEQVNPTENGDTTTPTDSTEVR